MQQFVVVAIYHYGTIVGQRAVCIGGELLACCTINIGNLLIPCNNLFREIENIVIDRHAPTSIRGDVAVLIISVIDRAASIQFQRLEFVAGVGHIGELVQNRTVGIGTL